MTLIKYKFTTKQIARIGILAAMQIVMGYVLAPVMFGPFGLFFTVMFNMLAWIWPVSILLANIIASMLNNLIYGGGVIDMLWGGVFGTCIVVGTVAFFRRWKQYKWAIWVAAVVSAIVSGANIGPMIGFTAGLPFEAWIGISGSVMLSDGLIQLVLGVPLVFLVKKLQKKVPALR